METEEAEKVVSILCTADNECPVCTDDLIVQFIKAFPEHKECAEVIFLKHFNCKLNLDGT